jgi:plastocyanin
VRLRRPLLILLALVALLGAACGDSGGTGDGTPTATGPTTPSPTAEPTDDCVDQTGDDQISLTMLDNAFDPVCLQVLASQPIQIENTGANVHSFTIDDTQVDVDVQPGQPFGGEGNAVAPGTYTFYCKYHGSPNGTGMAGHIIAG